VILQEEAEAEVVAEVEKGSHGTQDFVWLQDVVVAGAAVAVCMPKVEGEGEI
jgi:hypothetical protein